MTSLALAAENPSQPPPAGCTETKHVMDANGNWATEHRVRLRSGSGWIELPVASTATSIREFVK